MLCRPNYSTTILAVAISLVHWLHSRYWLLYHNTFYKNTLPDTDDVQVQCFGGFQQMWNAPQTTTELFV